MISSFINTYSKVEKPILNLIAAGFCLQFINASFFLTLNIYMQKSGYADYVIANYISYRFAAVVLFALPFGMFVKGKALRPFFFAASCLLPIVSLITIEAVNWHIAWVLQTCLVLWGISFSILFVITLPYILRNADPATHTEAISLQAASWSGALLLTGFLIYCLANLLPNLMTDKRLLQFFSFCGMLSIYFVWRMGSNEIVEPKTTHNSAQYYQYDWLIILKAALPTLLIAIGAGLAIPFMNLFFFNVFNIDADTFSLLGAVTAALVLFGSLLVPQIKKRFGYEAITITQLLSILMLVILATTDFVSHLPIALWIACGAYILRQPLMNLANPMTSEMTMYYVGKRNQEIMTAISSSIWSGSWFFSSQIFRFLREYQLRYGTIFYITAALYCLGVVVYYFLIRDFRYRQQQGIITVPGAE